MQTGQVKTFMKSLRLEWILNAQYMTKVYLYHMIHSQRVKNASREAKTSHLQAEMNL